MIFFMFELYSGWTNGWCGWSLFFISFTLQRAGLGLRGGIFREKRKMAFIQFLYIAKGGPGVKVPWMVQYPCNTSSVVFFCPLISETRHVYFSLYYFLGSRRCRGVRDWGLSCLRALCSTYLSTHGATWGSFRLLDSTISGSWHATERVSGSCSCECLVKSWALTPLSRYGNNCMDEETFYSLKQI